MLKSPFFKLIFYMLVGIAALHIIAIRFYFYWQFSWFDKFTHLLWGFWVALVILSFFIFKKYLNESNIKYKYFLLISFLSCLIIGIGWELFELKSGIISLRSRDFFIDSPLDILMDIIGGFFASIYVFTSVKYQNFINKLNKPRQDGVNK